VSDYEFSMEDKPEGLPEFISMTIADENGVYVVDITDDEAIRLVATLAEILWDRGSIGGWMIMPPGLELPEEMGLLFRDDIEGDQ
jgi:hypothetical protein